MPRYLGNLGPSMPMDDPRVPSPQTGMGMAPRAHGGTPVYERAIAGLEGLKPKTAPFQWEAVTEKPWYRAASPESREKLKRGYFEKYLARGDQTWEDFDAETRPSLLAQAPGQVAGAVQSTFGALQQSTGLALKSAGWEEAGLRLMGAGTENVESGQRSAYRPKHGEAGIGQFRNLSDLGWWQSLITETLPQSAPFMAAAFAGGAAGMPFGPPGMLLGAIIAGGGMAAFQEWGPSYLDYLYLKPGDTAGAMDYAVKRAGLSGVINAASIPLGMLGLPKAVAAKIMSGAALTAGEKAALQTIQSHVKHGLTQLAVQGAVGVGDQASQNALRKALLDPTQDVSEGLLRAGLGEGIVDAPGFVLSFRQVRKRMRTDAGLGDSAGRDPSDPPPGMPEGATPAANLFGADVEGAEDLPPAHFNPMPEDESETPAEAPDEDPSMPMDEPREEPPLPADALGSGPAPAPEVDLADRYREVRETQDPGLEAEANAAATSPLNERPEPTEPQKEAGNYKKGHIRFQGLDISIENPKFSTRGGKDADGRPWSRIMEDHYGYIRGTRGKDKDHLDVFIGPDEKSQTAFVVDQVKPDSGEFDEHKILLGYGSLDEARDGYLRNYEPGWQGLGAITPVPLGSLKLILPVKENWTKPYANFAASGFSAYSAERAPEPSVPVEKEEVAAAEPPPKRVGGTGKTRPIIGNQIQTKSGRMIPVPPQIRLDSDRKATKDLISQRQWLVEQVQQEAFARGDEYAQTLFQGLNPKNWSQADGDSTNLYLFGEESPVFERQELEDVGEGQLDAYDKLRNEVLLQFLAPVGTIPPRNNLELKQRIAKNLDKRAANVTAEEMKSAQEAFESALAEYARARVQDARKEGRSDRELFEALVVLYENQPRLDFRSGTSVQNQAYSTPLPIGYMANRLAGLEPGMTAYEPTAGNGMLILTGSAEQTIANEIDARRLKSLKLQGFRALQEDGAKAVANGKVPRGSAEVVIANPPFAKLAKPVTVDGYRVTRLGHLIAMDALGAMADNGRAALILPANKEAGAVNDAERPFLNWLYANFDVAANFELEGDLYARQGAAWPLRLIAVAGRRQTGIGFDPRQRLPRAANWEEAYGLFENALARAEDLASALGAAERPGAVGLEPGAEGAPAAEPPGIARESADEGGGPAEELPEGERAGAAVEGADPGGSAGSAGIGAAEALGERPAGPGSGGDGARERGVASATSAGSPEPAGPGTGGRGPDRLAGPLAEPGRTRLSPVPPTGGSEAAGQYQTPYKPESQAGGDAVLAPVNMEGSMARALAEVRVRHGDLDEYARKALVYSTREEMAESLMDMQVDGVAAVLHQIEQGKGAIIADQTGVGKGRQGAALIRYAVKNGLRPIYFTGNAGLFSDVYRDLAAIGSGELKLYPINSDAKVLAEDGRIVAESEKMGARRSTLGRMAAGHWPDGYDVALITYSQVNKKDNRQQMAMRGLAGKQTLIILDESHNAAGDSNTGQFFKELLKQAGSVAYLSATYAKRPDNMPVYFRTALGDSSSDDQSIEEAMAMGGVPLQTVVSNMLAQSGQLFRRERSMAGVSITEHVTTDTRERDEETSDRITGALRAIVEFDNAFAAVVDEIQDEVAMSGEVVQRDGTTAAPTVEHANFTSVIHNLVRQFLYALKANQVADLAIEALKRGEKPVVAVDSTMGSFLSHHVNQERIKTGQELPSLDYRSVLEKALNNQARVVVKRPWGVGDEHVAIPPHKWTAESKAAHAAALKLIRSLDVDLPVSPIDWIRHRLEQAGFSAAEITGRDLMVDYGQKTPVLAKRAPAERDKVGLVRRFNAGKVDTLIINRAGSEGISLHASNTFTDQRPRHMILAQTAQDINQFMQIMGRVHRTGQVALPRYTLVVSDIPAENRPAALLAKKLKSLNANTTSNTRGAASIEAPDFLNHYGDEVVQRYLDANGELASALDVDLKKKEDLARKATGRLAIQPIAVQHRFYDEVGSAYTSQIEYLNTIGENDLEPRTLDFDAKVKSEKALVRGRGEGGPFGEDAVYRELDIKAQGKPPKAAEVRQAEKETLGGKARDQYMADLVNPWKDAAADYFLEWKRIINSDAGEAQWLLAKSNAEEWLRRLPVEFAPGLGYRIKLGDLEVPAVVVELKTAWKPGQKGNPLAPSKLAARMLVAAGLRQVSIPLSQWHLVVNGNPVLDPPVETWFNVPALSRETAKVITGNLLAGYAAIARSGKRGSIVNYSTADGAVQQGILLSKDFNPAEHARVTVAFKSPGEVLSYLERARGDAAGVYTADTSIRLTLIDGEYGVTVATARNLGGVWHGDPKFKTLFGGQDPAWKQGVKYANLPLDAKRVRPFIEFVQSKQTLVAPPSGQLLAEDVIAGASGKEKPKASRRNEGRSAETEEAAATGRRGLIEAVMRRQAERIFGAAAPKLRIVNELMDGKETLYGRYSPAKHLIEIAMGAKNTTLPHEFGHAALRWVLPEQDIAILERTYLGLEGQRVIKRLETEGNSAAAEDARNDLEERIAYGLEMALERRLRPPPVAQRLFDKFWETVRKIGEWLRGAGFRSAEDVFRDLFEGRFARKEAAAPLRAYGTDLSVQEEGRNFGEFIEELEREDGLASRRMVAGVPEDYPRGFTDRVLAMALGPVMPVWKVALDRLEKAGARLMPERLKAGWVDRYGATENLVAAGHEYDRALIRQANRARDVVGRIASLTREQSGVVHEWLQEKPDTERERVLIAQLPEQHRAAVREIKQMIRDLGREAVNLGLVSEESFKRNEHAYLHRLYRQHELTERGGLTSERIAHRKIIGDELRGRGMFDERAAAKAFEHAAQATRGRFLGQGVKGEQFMLFNKYDRNQRRIGVAYVPDGDPVPEKLLRLGWTRDDGADGTPNLWEVRHQVGGKITFWRDFTKHERESLGEINEVRYVAARTLLAMARDIETARYFAWIERDPDLAVGDASSLPDGATVVEASENMLRPYLAKEWVLVPDSRIARSGGVKKYGALAGKYVSGPVWNEIRQVGNWHQFPALQAFQSIMRAFKIAKTAFQPTVHMNNVMANLLMADMADLPYHQIGRATLTGLKALRGDAEARATIRRAQEGGSFGGTFVLAELRKDVLAPLEEELRKELAEGGPAGHALEGARVLALLESTWHGIQKVGRGTIDLYQWEDNVFRLAMFLHETERGAPDGDAGRRARDAFLDYNIRAPWVNIARQTGWPFLAFAYRIIPKLYDTLKHKPWKMLKWYAAASLLNAMGYALSGGDEDDERRLLPEEKSGRILGIFPRLIRMPWNDVSKAGKNPVFLDILRWIPGGDLLRFEDSKSAIPVLPIMTPAGPLALLLELFANRSLFTGDDIRREMDRPGEAASKVLLHVYRTMAPNNVLVPFSFAWERMGLPGSTAAQMDPFGREYSPGLAWANALGVKLQGYPLDVLQMNIVKDMDRQERETSTEIYRLTRLYVRRGLTQSAFLKQRQAVVDQFREYLQKQAARLKPAAA